MPELQSEVRPETKTTTKTPNDVVDLFKELDNEEEVKKPSAKTKSEPEVEPDDEENEEIQLVEDEEEEEALDLSKSEDEDEVTIDAPPRKKELLKDFPDLFKKHPFLEKMLYRDRQYTELFGSFDDAKEIAEKAEVFSNFESQLLGGDTEEVLRNVKETDSKAFDKIVDNYLGVLAKVDKDAYYEVIGNIGKKLITEMVSEANESNNEELKQAALIINQFLFNTSKFVPVKLRVTKEEADKSEAEQERLSFVQERFETARDDLQGRVDNILKSTISEYIDPKGTMTAYVKKNAISDALKFLHSSIGIDTGLRKNLDKLWRAAFDSKFSKDSLGKIQSFYLGRAKASLPSAIKKARAEALKDLLPRKASEEQEEEKEETETVKPQRKGPITPGRPPQTNKAKRQKGESVAEFFARD